MRGLIAAVILAALVPGVTPRPEAPALSALAGPICRSHGAGAPAPVQAASQPDWSELPPPPARVILAGYGTGGFAIRTSSPKAQAFFDNGMQLGHAFAHKPARAAFEAAEAADPACAMCVWGEAWARGPTINFGVDDRTQTELAGLADKAAALARNGPPLEQELTAALQLRYRKGGGEGPGDRAYAAAMDRIARQHPQNSELAVLAADSWMIPVALSNALGPNQPDLLRAIGLLQPVLARDPDDTGAIHFYIHATEMIGEPGRALPYALRLEALAPAASHLVHMPSHTYFRVGRYQAAVAANLHAVGLDEADAERLRLKAGVWDLGYHAHNVAFGEGAALVSGDRSAALRLSQPVVARATDATMGPSTVGAAYFAMGRYADPGQVAALPDPGLARPYVQMTWRYARGEAAARRGDARVVRAEAAQIAVDPAALQRLGSGATMARITRLVLEGRADRLEHRPEAAATAFAAAAALQEKDLGLLGDPPAFWYPIRRSLADADVQMGRFADAEREARRTLERWPADPVTLTVLARAESAQGRRADAARDLGKARAGWRGGAAPLGPEGA